MPFISKAACGVLAAILASAAPASPLFPLIETASSPNGAFLVRVDFSLSRDMGGGARQIQKETFHVQRQVSILNAKDVFQTSARFWGTLWSFDLDPKANTYAVQGIVPFVTDDGESVVLVNVAPAMSGNMEALRVYRHDGSGGAFVRSVLLSDLWTAEQLRSIQNVFTDASPQWFAAGSFHFSEDSREVIVGTTWGNRKVIRLRPE
jgi:hypothetical protein